MCVWLYGLKEGVWTSHKFCTWITKNYFLSSLILFVRALHSCSLIPSGRQAETVSLKESSLLSFGLNIKSGIDVGGPLIYLLV